jgi:hypothetical protein
MHFFRGKAAGYAEGVAIIQPSEEAEGKGAGRSWASQVARHELPWVLISKRVQPERVASALSRRAKVHNRL